MRIIYSSVYFSTYVCVCISIYINKRTSSEFSVWKKKMLFEQLWQSNTAATAASRYKGISKTRSITACGVCHGTTCCYLKNTFYLAEKWWDEVAIKNSRIVLFTCMAGHFQLFFFLCECTENAHKMSWGWSFQCQFWLVLSAL